jgi:hypothetical protein
MSDGRPISAVRIITSPLVLQSVPDKYLMKMLMKLTLSTLLLAAAS